MKCPICGKEIPDGSKFCSFCGANLETSNSISNQVKESTASSAYSQVGSSGGEHDVLTPENFRSAPNYKKNLFKMIIFGGVAFILSALGLLGSILFRFGDQSTFDLVLMLIGMLSGLAFFIVTLTFNKKVFPTTQYLKMKGLEILVPIFIAFTLACLVMALGAQGLYLIIN